MDAVSLALNLGTCIFEALIFYTFERTFLPERPKIKRWKYLLILLVIAINFIVNAFYNSGWNLISNISLDFLLVWILFKASNSRKLLFAFLGCTILMSGEFITGIVLGVSQGLQVVRIEEGTFNPLFGILSSKIISFVVFKIVEYINGQKNNEIGTSTFICFYIFPLTTMCIFIGLIYAEDSPFFQSILIIGCLSLLIANVLLFYVYDHLIRSVDKIKEFERFQTRTSMEKAHYDRLNEVNKHYDKIMHDLDKQLTTIGSLAQNNDDQQIVNIIKSMNIDINKTEGMIYCYNSIVNAIINDKKAYADNIGVKVSVYVDPLFQINYVDDYDLISMLSNLLDNALEASEQLGNNKGYIDIKMSMVNENHFSCIRITNNFLIKPVEIKGLFQTIKKDKQHHGIGINKVRELANKYGGF